MTIWLPWSFYFSLIKILNFRKGCLNLVSDFSFTTKTFKTAQVLTFYRLERVRNQGLLLLPPPPPPPHPKKRINTKRTNSPRRSIQYLFRQAPRGHTAPYKSHTIVQRYVVINPDVGSDLSSVRSL